MRSSVARLGLALGLSLAAGCQRLSPEEYQRLATDPELLHGAVQQVTSTMVDRVMSPPVAARTYTYAGVAAYEALRHGHPGYASFAGQVNGLQPVPAPPAGAEHLLPLSAVYAYLTVAQPLVFNTSAIGAYRDSVVQSLRDRGVPDEVVDRSVEYGQAVAKHVLAWADQDGLKKARSSERLNVENLPGRWIPTPPAYMDAVEPNWAMVRTFALDSAGQFPPPPPAEYDLTPGSPFHRQLLEVYEARRALTPEQREIAGFWDCNPFAVEFVGHMMSSAKKISPGGHWLGITGIALRKTDADLMRSAEAYARVSMVLADGFISAWEEKFRSVRVRPVTVIQDRMERGWEPLLQTPPFPEYPSGHSVVSAAAAEVLTDLFGDDFSFVDDTEVPFGLRPRTFASFRQAAEEAAISRLYGGIHYRDAIENGVVQGRSIAQRLLGRVHTRGAKLTAK